MSCSRKARICKSFIFFLILYFVFYFGFMRKLIDFTQSEGNKGELKLKPKNWTGDRWEQPKFKSVFKYRSEMCNCIKSVKSPYPKEVFHGLRTTQNYSGIPISTCSHDTTLHGPNQRVVSFTLFLTKDRKIESESAADVPKTLFEMAWINLQLIREHYPGWVMRVYSNLLLFPNHDMCRLLCENDDFFWCDITHIPGKGDMSSMMYMTWRDLTLGDPTVDTFVVRDLDSFILKREAAAVQDWLKNTDKAIHVMRDKYLAHDTEILGGMWGASNTLLNEHAPLMQKKLIEESEKNPASHHWGYNYDQHMLWQVVYMPYRDAIVAHDSYHCETYGRDTLIRPFPTERVQGYDIVGSPYAYPYPMESCPEECRPAYGKNWTNC